MIDEIKTGRGNAWHAQLMEGARNAIECATMARRMNLEGMAERHIEHAKERLASAARVRISMTLEPWLRESEV